MQLQQSLSVTLCSLALACGGGGTSGGAGGSAGAGGSGGGAGTGGSGGELGQVCLEQSEETTPDGHTVLNCTRAFPQAPRVALPDDQNTADGRIVYAGVDPSARTLIVRGEDIVVPEASFEQFDSEWTDIGSSGLAGTRYGYALYRVNLEPDNTVTSFAPVVLIDDRVLLEAFLAGARFEGKISSKEQASPEPKYALHADLPIALTFSAAATLDDTPDPLHGYRIARLDALVENFDTATVIGSDCAPPLDSHGDASPLTTEASRTLSFSRAPNMHGAFDDVMVVTWPEGSSNMGGGLYVSPGLLLRNTAPSQIYGSSPHGTPWSAPHLDLSPSTPPSGSCP